MNKKRLVICSPELGIAPQSDSGGEVYDRETIRALCNRGVKVIVILPWKKPYLKHKNLIVYYLPFPFIWPPYLFNFFIIPYLFYLYKKYKFDILRIHSPYFTGLGVLFFKFFHPKIPLVVHYHHLEDNFLFHLINKLFIKFWDMITTDSFFSKKEISKRYKLEKARIQVIYAGVDKMFKAKKKNNALIKKYRLQKKQSLLFLGGLKERKNVGFLLELLPLIKVENIRLLICGKGDLKKTLIDQVKRLSLEDKVIFTGFIPEEEKVDYYNLADVFLFPSRKEGFGMPIIEAGACGIAAVASDVSSLKELLINGRTGYLAEFNNLKDWRDKLEKLLNNKNLREKMGDEAQKFSQQFSWLQSAVKQIKIYKSLIINH